VSTHRDKVVRYHLLIATCNRYLEAAKLNESQDKFKEALRCAERGLEIDRDCLGIDHPLYQTSLKAVDDLRRVQ
jgi:hypothetical protein